MIKDLSLINKDLALIRLDVVCKPVRDMWFQFLNTGEWRHYNSVVKNNVKQNYIMVCKK